MRISYSLWSRLFPVVAAAATTLACSSDDKAAPGNGGTDGGTDSGVDGAAQCPSKPEVDPNLSQRTSCTYEAGSKATDTIGMAAAKKKLPIEHIILVMKENRSFDHLFGTLSKDWPEVDGIPADFSNKDATGAEVKPYHLTSTCQKDDPEHQWVQMHAQVNGGKMDGFVTSAAETATPGPSDGHFAMGYYDETDLPFYHFLAKTFALSDKNFASVRSGTWSNRDYLYAGTSDGIKDTITDGILDASLNTIFKEMDAAGVTWASYADNAPLSFALGWGTDHAGVKKFADLLTDSESGNLPAVSFVDGRLNEEDDHPPADLQKGEAWVKQIYDAAIASPVWGSTAILFTYDEAGGFADHVPPPSDACVARPENPKDTEFFELGIRVPLIAISPWARRHYVSHVPHEHTSITRLIELTFDLPALTKRDANSDALLELFDFECPNGDALPTAPSAGTGGCTTP